jgi:predicted TIM-barrel fold metal-dependent hydrolase
MADVGVINARRLVSPGTSGWARGVRPESPDRYLVITIDSHVGEPNDVYEQGGIAPEYFDRLPRLVIDGEGRHFITCEGFKRPQLVMGRPKGTEYEAQWERDGLDTTLQMWSDRMEPDDLMRMRAGSTKFADEADLQRMRTDMAADGVDGAVVFANRGLLSFATADPVFAAAMSHAWNVWARETYRNHWDQFAVAAQLATADIALALAEVEWIVEQGFRAVNIPCKPLHGHRDPDEDLAYNHPSFDPLWAALEAADLPVCMHVATGRDPRAATGSGGAIINKVVGFLQGTMEPLAVLLASGVFQRYPGLRFVTVEADIGWIPWLLESLDTASNKHHMWVRPVLDQAPSRYWYSNCYAAFIEDEVGLALARSHHLIDNIMWSNDYPHHEGTWPHSPEAMERNLQGFDETERAKLLGLNAAKLFKFDVTKLQNATGTKGPVTS